MTDILDPFEGQPVDFKDDPDDAATVIETHSGTRVPRRDGNRHWEFVKRWVAQGNTIKAGSDLAQRKNRKLAQVEPWMNRKLDNLHVNVDGHNLFAGSRSAAFVALVQAVVNSGTPLPANWQVLKTDGSRLTVNEAQHETYATEIALAQQAVRMDAADKADAIRAATSDAELDVVDLS